MAKKVVTSESIDSFFLNNNTENKPQQPPVQKITIEAPIENPVNTTHHLSNKEKLEKLRAKSKTLDTMIKKFNLELTI